MNIEVKTTSRKLTKALINQMRMASREVMRNGNVLGFVIGIVKDSYKSILIEYRGDYFTIEANYERTGNGVYRKRGKWSSHIIFTTDSNGKTDPADVDDWFQVYKSCLAKATDQIYI